MSPNYLATVVTKAALQKPFLNFAATVTHLFHVWLQSRNAIGPLKCILETTQVTYRQFFLPGSPLLRIILSSLINKQTNTNISEVVIMYYTYEHTKGILQSSLDTFLHFSCT